MKVRHGSTLIMIDSYFSPFSFTACPLFLLVIIYAYHYQSVKTILKLLGPLSTKGAAFAYVSCHLPVLPPP